jgi:uncharacterized protein YggE
MHVTVIPKSLVGTTLLALVLAPLAAQTPLPGTVTATGSAEIKRQPELLRVQVEVMAKGKTIKEALAKLKERRDATLARVVELGAAKDNVVFGEANVGSEKTDRQVQMEQMLRMRLRTQGKKAPKAKEAPVVVTAQLKADFPLAAASPEEFLVAAHTLQEKIKAADLGGAKDAAKLSPEEEEVAEELGGDEAMNDPSQPKRGEPVLLYVRKLTEDDRAKALAEAFAKAKREASRLAKSAGAELGGLHHLANQVGAGGDAEEPNPYVRQAYYTMMQQARLAQNQNDEAGAEAVGVTPAKVTLRVSVTAYFGIKPGADK